MKFLMVYGSALALLSCSEAAPVAAPPDGNSVPAAPTMVTASAGSDYNTIRLDWQKVPGATSYNIYWGTSPAVTVQNGTKIAGVGHSPYGHTGLTANTTYYYLITALNGSTEGPVSTAAHATASGDLAFQMYQPSAGGLQSTQLSIVVKVVSRFQLAGVAADVGGPTTPLVFKSDAALGGGQTGPAWVGTLSLAGLPHGTLTLTVSATDVFASEAEAAVAVIHDQVPAIVVSAPDDFTVARPGLHVTVSCADDDPAGCTGLTVAIADPPDPPSLYYVTTVATGQGSIDQTVSLAAWEGHHVALIVTGGDSAGQRTAVTRMIYVESSTHLTEVAAVKGRILDVLPDRILSLDQTKSDSALIIRDRLAGTDSVISHGGASAAFLTPVGAVFVASGQLTSVEHGAAISLGPGVSLRVNGNFGIWLRPPAPLVLMRRDFGSGGNVVVSTSAASSDGVATNGDVVYPTTATYQTTGTYQVTRFRDGISTQLTNDTLWHYDPLTDGVSVVYLAYTYGGNVLDYRIVLYDSTGEHLLTAPDRTAGYGYQINNGWVVYTKVGTAGERQVWTHSPNGQEQQVTAFGTSSAIAALGPNGEVAIVNGSRRYLALPAEGYALHDISSALGSAFFQGGSLYVTIGRSLFVASP